MTKNDLENFQIDSLFHCLQIELNAGYTERIMTIIQSLLELNFNTEIINNLQLLKMNEIEFEKYFDSEYPRIGECLNQLYGFQQWILDGKPQDAGELWLKIRNFNNIHTKQLVFNYILQEKELLIISEDDIVNLVTNAQVENETENETNKISRKRKYAIDFFNEIETEMNQFAEPITINHHSEDLNDENTEMIYSRVHGYRIPIIKPKLNETTNAYTRALHSLKSHENNNETNDNETIEALSHENNNKSMKDIHYNHKQRNFDEKLLNENLLSSVEYQPMRLLADNDINDEIDMTQ